MARTATRREIQDRLEQLRLRRPTPITPSSESDLQNAEALVLTLRQQLAVAEARRDALRPAPLTLAQEARRSARIDGMLAMLRANVADETTPIYCRSGIETSPSEMSCDVARLEQIITNEQELDFIVARAGDVDRIILDPNRRLIGFGISGTLYGVPTGEGVVLSTGDIARAQAAQATYGGTGAGGPNIYLGTPSDLRSSNATMANSMAVRVGNVAATAAGQGITPSTLVSVSSAPSL